MKPMFSVIVPIYKVEKYLKKCIDSILSQTYTDYELILVDDGSPDSCPKICDEYSQKDKRVRVIHQKNGGLVNARNTGVREARGQYICYVDGDDWISETLLETVYEKGIKKQKSDIVIYSGVKQFENYQEQLPKGLPEGFYDKKALEEKVYPYMMYDNRKPFCNGLIFPVAWNKVFKTEILKEHYCEEEKIRMGEDNAFVFECLIVANSIYFCDDNLYFYNQLNSGSITSNYDKNRFKNNQLLTNYIEKKIGGINKVIDEQINAFNAYWLIMAIFHEIKSGRKNSEIYKHIKEEIKETQVVKNIKLSNLPTSAKMYLILLKMHLYFIAIIGARVINKKRGE